MSGNRMKAVSFKESLRKTVIMLAGEGVTVQFRGFQPRVETRGDSGEVRATQQEFRRNAGAEAGHRGDALGDGQAFAGRGADERAERVLRGGETTAAEAFVDLGLRGVLVGDHPPVQHGVDVEQRQVAERILEPRMKI